VIALLLIACTALHVLALALWFGSQVLGRALGAGAAPERSSGAARLAAPLIALASGLAWLPLQAASIFDLGLTLREIPGASLLVLDTGFGRTWLLHLVPIAVGLLAIGVRAGAERLVFLLSAAALGSLAFHGHAAALPGSAGLVVRGATTLHILAAGAWAGSLPALAAFCARLEPGSLAPVLRRYSRLGIWLVATLLASGLALAVVHLGSDAGAIARSAYGRLLALKVLLVAAMGGLALRNRNRFTPALECGDPEQVAGAASGVRASIRIEAAIGAAVVTLAVLLAGTEKPE
jgi:putative copper resistance protein D